MTLSLEKEVREALERMTDAPWCFESVGEKVNEYVIGTALDDDDKPLSGELVGDDFVGDEEVARTGLFESANSYDVAGIVLLRNSAPALLAELARMREQVKALQAALGAYVRKTTDADRSALEARDSIVGADVVGDVRACEQSLAAALRERDEAREDRDARRESLAQEIRGCLKSRGQYAPPPPACDLIGAVGAAIDKLTAARDSAQREGERMRGEAKESSDLIATLNESSVQRAKDHAAQLSQRDAELARAVEILMVLERAIIGDLDGKVPAWAEVPNFFQSNVVERLADRAHTLLSTLAARGQEQAGSAEDLVTKVGRDDSKSCPNSPPSIQPASLAPVVAEIDGIERIVQVMDDLTSDRNYSNEFVGKVLRHIWWPKIRSALTRSAAGNVARAERAAGEAAP